MTESPISPSTIQLILDAIRGALFNLHTGLPGRVLSVPERGCVDVAPLLRRTYQDDDGNEQTVDLPVISRVPLLFPCGGGWNITWPVAPGDLVYLAFAERSLDKWKDAPAGQTVDPAEARAHALSDAVALPALRPRSAPLDRYSQTNLRLGRQDGSAEIELTPAGTILLKGAAIQVGGPAGEPMVRGSALMTLLGKIGTAVGGIPGGAPAGSTIAAAIASDAALVLSAKGTVE